MSISKKIAYSGVVMALYIVVVFATQGFSFGLYQIRIATALYALAFHFPFLVVPLALANMLIHSQLFRPPHGWLRWGHANLLTKKYRLIFWDLVTRDYSNRLDADQVIENVKKFARNGSIITFHDQPKSWHNLQKALPASIEWLMKEGYEFKLL